MSLDAELVLRNSRFFSAVVRSCLAHALTAEEEPATAATADLLSASSIKKRVSQCQPTVPIEVVNKETEGEGQDQSHRGSNKDAITTGGKR